MALKLLLLSAAFFCLCPPGIRPDDQLPSESQCRPYIEKALKGLERAAESSEEPPAVEISEEPYVDRQKRDAGEAPPGAAADSADDSTEDAEMQGDAPAAESEESGEVEPAEEAQSGEETEEEVGGAAEEASAESEERSAEIASEESGEETAEGASEESEKTEEEAAGEASEESTEEASEEAKPEAAEEASEEVKEESAEEASEEAKEESAEEASEEAKEESAEEASEEAKEESAEEVSEEAKEESAEEASEEAKEESAEEASKEVKEESTEETEEESAEKTSEEAKEESAEETSEDAKEVSAEDTSEEAEEESTEEASEDDAVEEASEEDKEETAEGASEETAEEAKEETTDEASEQVEEETIEEAEEESKEETPEEASAESAETEAVAESAEAEEEAAPAVEEEAQADEAASPEETSEDGEEEPKETEAKVALDEIGERQEAVDEAEPAAEETAEESPEEDLLLEIDIPENLRSRDHVAQILRLDEESTESERLIEKSSDSTLRELKRLYDGAIKPLEILYKYRDLSNRHFGDPEIFSKPLVLFMGPWSGGKSSLINYLTDNEFTEWSLRTGAEPSPAYFNILMHGKEPEVLDGTQLAADWTFSGLQKFGQGLEERLRGLKLPNKLLERVNIVEIPGILEVRKQVSRVFPFNDACQWFIDRADVIFLVYDPSKLDVGPETEAILDQLKGREAQTRILLNKGDQVKPEELMRVQSALIWNISPLMSSAQPPVMYTASLWSMPYEVGAPARLLQSQEKAFLKDLRAAIDKRVENKIASARRFAVRVRNHAKMVDCYLTTYYNHKTIFANKKVVAEAIVDHPQNYHIYEGLSTLTNISRYDLPDPETYADFFRLNPLYEFQQLAATCTYFRGCPINRLDVAIAYDLPELVGKYKKTVESATPRGTPKS